MGETLTDWLMSWLVFYCMLNNISLYSGQQYGRKKPNSARKKATTIHWLLQAFPYIYHSIFVYISTLYIGRENEGKSQYLASDGTELFFVDLYWLLQVLTCNRFTTPTVLYINNYRTSETHTGVCGEPQFETWSTRTTMVSMSICEDSDTRKTVTLVLKTFSYWLK